MLAGKKTCSASQAITTYRVVLLCFFVFFVVYFVFRFLPLRLTQNHPDAKKFLDALASLGSLLETD